MRRVAVLTLWIASCVGTAAVGYWFGVGYGLQVGIAADMLPRAVLATEHLKELRSGSTRAYTANLEADVDAGLVWGDKVLRSPVASIAGPLWGFELKPAYEQYAMRVARYRREFPSQSPGDPAAQATVSEIIERYAPSH